MNIPKYFNTGKLLLNNRNVIELMISKDTEVAINPAEITSLMEGSYGNFTISRPKLNYKRTNLISTEALSL